MSERKQIPLRVSGELYNELMKWADDEFRSINGQIEYLLTECVKKRKNIETAKNSLNEQSGQNKP